jgi:hypothetical protein
MCKREEEPLAARAVWDETRNCSSKCLSSPKLAGDAHFAALYFGPMQQQGGK